MKKPAAIIRCERRSASASRAAPREEPDDDKPRERLNEAVRSEAHQGDRAGCDPRAIAIANSTKCQAFPPQARSLARRSSRARGRRGGARPGKARATTESGRTRLSHDSLLMGDVLEADVEQEPNMGVVERVVDVAALLAITDEPMGSEQAHVVTHGCLRQPTDRRKVTDAQLSGLQERRDEPHPARVRQHPECFGELLKNLLLGQTPEDGSHTLRVNALDLALVRQQPMPAAGRKTEIIFTQS